MMKYLLLVLSIVGQAYAGFLKLPDVFSDGLVLQCEMPVTVWGESQPNAEVQVRIDGQVKTTRADLAGAWEVSLEAHAPGGSFELSVVASDETVLIQDVYYGEVWLATGQSNMVMTLAGSQNGKERLKEEDTMIRYWLVPKKTRPDAEAQWPKHHSKWLSMQIGENDRISAVGYYFAKDLRARLDRPVAILHCCYGGTPAQAWVPNETLMNYEETSHFMKDYEALLETKTPEQWRIEYIQYLAELKDYIRDSALWRKNGKQGKAPVRPVEQKGYYHRQSPAVLYNEMTQKVIPFTARGFIWYQGEGNASDAATYKVLFPALIERWRQDWRTPDMPFYFVQLSAFDHKAHQWACLRNVQTWVSENIPNTGMAVSIDVGDKTDIHPKEKAPVGQRLARHALAKTYGISMITESPSVDAVQLEANAILVEFKCVGEGLRLDDEGEQVHGFEVMLSDGEFVAVPARIVSPNTVALDVSNLDRFKGKVRYGWSNFPEPKLNLYSSEGLPAIPYSNADSCW